MEVGNSWLVGVGSSRLVGVGNSRLVGVGPGFRMSKELESDTEGLLEKREESKFGSPQEKQCQETL